MSSKWKPPSPRTSPTGAPMHATSGEKSRLRRAGQRPPAAPRRSTSLTAMSTCGRSRSEGSIWLLAARRVATRAEAIQEQQAQQIEDLRAKIDRPWRFQPGGDQCGSVAENVRSRPRTTPNDARSGAIAMGASQTPDDVRAKSRAEALAKDTQGIDDLRHRIAATWTPARRQGNASVAFRQRSAGRRLAAGNRARALPSSPDCK